MRVVRKRRGRHEEVLPGAPPALTSVHRLLDLQRTAGNRAVVSMLGPIPVQRGRRGRSAVGTKSKGGAMRVNGPYWQLAADVSAVIAGNNKSHMGKTASTLRRSIAARKAEHERRKGTNPAADASHQHRIKQEEALLVRVETALANVDDNAWTTV